MPQQASEKKVAVIDVCPENENPNVGVLASLLAKRYGLSICIIPIQDIDGVGNLFERFAGIVFVPAYDAKVLGIALRDNPELRVAICTETQIGREIYYLINAEKVDEPEGWHKETFTNNEVLARFFSEE